MRCLLKSKTYELQQVIFYAVLLLACLLCTIDRIATPADWEYLLDRIKQNNFTEI